MRNKIKKTLQNSKWILSKKAQVVAVTSEKNNPKKEVITKSTDLILKTLETKMPKVIEVKKIQSQLIRIRIMI